MEKKTVNEIITERLIEKIQEEKRLPWQKPFSTTCMNWYSNTEYRGINTLLLPCGEYITINQLREYNKKHKTEFSIEKGTPSYIVVFYTKRERKCTADEISEYETKGIPANLLGKVYKNADDEWVRSTWTLRYYTVFNILDVHDKEGNTLEPKIGKTVFQTYTPAEDIIKKYCEGSGVQIKEDGEGKCFYTERDDSCHLTARKYFKGEEEFYRVAFHEMTHSTGIKKRLARSCFEKYHEGRKERSREELVAEVGSLLLATEAGFKDDYCDDNSDNYITSWCSWMKDNPQEVVTGIYQAEKAKCFILSGGKKGNDDFRDGTSESKID